MIHSITITNNETEQLYHITKTGHIWIENQDEEGLVITEPQLYSLLDQYFKAEL